MKEDRNKKYELLIQELKETYKDPRWFVKRRKILERDEHKCQNCKSGISLEVHHSYYDNKPAWDYPDESLITLCRSCHKSIHEIRKTIRDFSGDYSNDILQTIYWAETYCGQKSETGYNSLKWADKMKKIITRDYYRCQICDSSYNLEVHHIIYGMNKPTWDYPDESLITLCSSCHEEADKLKEDLNDLEGEHHIGILQDIFGAKNFLIDEPAMDK
jgi:5-methylcytosine-specific restriction endonuclease McrA